MSQYREKIGETVLPVIALRGLVLYPDVPTSFELSRSASIKAMEAATAFDGNVFMTAQKDLGVALPKLDNVERVGCVAKIRQATKLPNGHYRIIAEGVTRGEISEELSDKPFLRAKIRTKSIDYIDNGGIKGDALMRNVRDSFEEMLQLLPNMSPELITAVQAITAPGLLCDFIAANLLHRLEDKQKILEIYDPLDRLGVLLTILARECEVLSSEIDIHNKVKESLETNQRKAYLREQLKVIQSELGMSDEEYVDEAGEPLIPDDDVKSILSQIKDSGCPDEVKKALMKEAAKLARMPVISAESSVIRDYVDTVTSLPWGVHTEDRFDVEAAKIILDEDHDALEKVKDRILEYISVKQLAPELRGQILLLVGPPGVGKTSVAKSVAKAMNRKFVRVSLGGIRDEAEIRGHRKTYVAAMPGRIITALKGVGTSNPVMLLDEIDKMSKDMHGDPSAALLEVLDVDQNRTFRDHYVEFPFDISDCIFIATANTLDTVPRPLLDRMEIIRLPAYTLTEKISIFKNHLLPKEMKAHGLKKNVLRVKDDAIVEIIEHYTKESGVRNLERETAALCRKIARKLVETDKKSFTVNAKNITEYLGKQKVRDMRDDTKAKVGIVNGLAWTEVGGELLQVETVSMPGTGKVEITGSLGDVMKESARTAVSLIRKNADTFGVDSKFYKNKDIHIHFPEGAIPKDGPSAGITMVTALVSELCGKKVRGDVAMTGEITLSGRVFPIGGLREKTMAAYKHGMKTVIIPSENRIDLEECDKTVRESLEFVYADTIEDVLSVALVK